MSEELKSYAGRVMKQVKMPPRDAGEEQRLAGNMPFNTGYERGHAQAKVDARQIAAEADKEINYLKSQLAATKKELQQAREALEEISDHEANTCRSFAQDYMEVLAIAKQALAGNEALEDDMSTEMLAGLNADG